MQLNEYQKEFKDIMLDHPDVVDHIENHLDKTKKEFACLFHSGDIPVSERLKVYRNNIVGGITDIVIATFPLLEQLVGREFLEAMARSFLLENPPQEGCLNYYGEGFDAFIKTYKPAQNLAYLSDVATLEIALNAAYFASDDKVLQAHELAAIPADDLISLIVCLRDSVSLLSSDYPLENIRDFCLKHQKAANNSKQAKQGKNSDNSMDTTDSAQDNETLNLDNGPSYLLIYRPHLEPMVLSLKHDEFLLLEYIQDGLCLGESVERTLEKYPCFDIQNFLTKHIDLETFKALETK